MINKDDVVLITGCGGMLGEGVYSLFKDSCRVFATDIDVNEDWLTYLDVSSHTEVNNFCEKISPNYIINLAAKTDLEWCEENVSETYNTNMWGSDYLMEQSRSRDIPYLYIGTAGIFDGKKDQYNERDIPNPLSTYGKAKYGGELCARAYNKSIVARAGWMIGGGPKKDKKFINKIIKQIKNGATELFVVNDKFGIPCYTYDFAKVIKHLLDNELYGLYHGVCEGVAGSRYDVAEHLLDVLGLKDKIKINIVDSDYFKSEYSAPRPLSEKMVNSMLKEKGIDITRDWRECLDEYMNKFDWGV